MRNSLLYHRIRYQLHQHPDERPETAPIRILDWDDTIRTVQIPVEEYPSPWVMPIYEYPGILRRVKEEDTRYGVVTILVDSEQERMRTRLRNKLEVKEVLLSGTGPENWTFAKWIAKISYSFSVACLGFDAVKGSPLASATIDGYKQFNYMIGGLNYLRLPSQEFWLEASTKDLFHIRLTDMATHWGEVYWVVYLRMLPILSSPSYIAVICKKT